MALLGADGKPLMAPRDESKPQTQDYFQLYGVSVADVDKRTLITTLVTYVQPSSVDDVKKFVQSNAEHFGLIPPSASLDSLNASGKVGIPESSSTDKVSSISAPLIGAKENPWSILPLGRPVLGPEALNAVIRSMSGNIGVSVFPDVVMSEATANLRHTDIPKADNDR